MATTTITLRLAESEKQAIADYAETLGKSICEFVRGAVLSRIEDELDLAAWEDDKRKFEEDPRVLALATVAEKHLEPPVKDSQPPTSRAT